MKQFISKPRIRKINGIRLIWQLRLDHANEYRFTTWRACVEALKLIYTTGVSPSWEPIERSHGTFFTPKAGVSYN